MLNQIQSKRNNKLKILKKERTKFIEGIENSKEPFLFFVLIFFAAITARFILEVMFSYYSKTFFHLPGFLQMLFFYSTAAATAIILIHLFTKTDLKKVSKIVLPAFWFITLAPLIDFIVSQGRGYVIKYIFESNDILFDLFTIGGKNLYSGITIGLRVEIILVLFLFFYYLQLKNPDILKNGLKTFTFYCIIFFYLCTPLVLKPFMENFSFDLSEFWIESINGYFLFFSAFLILIGLSLYNKKLIKLILQDIRPIRLAHFLLMFYTGLLIGVKFFGFNLGFEDLLSILLVSFAIIFAWVFSVIQNNIEDIKIDLVSNKNRPLSTGISPEQYNSFSLFFLYLSLAFALAMGITGFLAIFLFILLYFLYSNHPFRIKQVPILSKLCISLSSLILMILGFIVAGGAIQSFPLSISILFLIGFTLAINFIDIKDYLGDKKERIATLPVILGLKKAKLLTGIFFALAYLLAYFVVQELVLLPIVIIFAIVEFVLINRKEYSEAPIFEVYLLSLIVIAYVYFV